MQKVILKALYHRGQECIGIYFEKNADLQKTLQKEAKPRWSKTHRCWYVACTGENYLRLKCALENMAELEISELKKYLLEKKKNNPAHALASEKKTVIPKEVHKDIKKIADTPNQIHTISKQNREALQQFTRQLTLKAYSQSTIRTYTNEFMQFLNTLKE